MDVVVPTLVWASMSSMDRTLEVEVWLPGVSEARPSVTYHIKRHVQLPSHAWVEGTQARPQAKCLAEHRRTTDFVYDERVVNFLNGACTRFCSIQSLNDHSIKRYRATVPGTVFASW